MSRKLILIGVLSLALAPSAALSLGMGDIRLNSHLNQPMDAEISLSVASAAELETLKVELAAQEAFARHGISRPAYFDDLRFQVRRTGPSSAVVQVSSSRPIVEPFLTFLVEARWSGGRVLREFTVLLDPPVFMPGPAAESAPAAAPPVESPRSEPAPRPAPEPAARPSPAPAPAARAPQRADYGPEYGPVQRNETLWAIAQRVREDDSLTTSQVMMALFHANPGAFDGNVNRLRAGAILRVPSREEISAASAGQANAEFRRQMEDWRGARTESVQRRLELAPPDEATRPTPPASEPVRDPATAPVAAPELLDAVQQLRSELADTRRLMEVKDAEIASLQARLAELEGQPPAAPADEPPAEAAEEPEAVAPEPAPEAQVAPRPAPQPAPQPAVPAPSLVDRVFGVLGNVWLWLVVAVLLIVAAVAVFLRKRQQEERSIEQDLAETGTWGTLDATAAAAAAGTARPRRGEGLESILVEEREAPRARKEPEARSRPEAAPPPAEPAPAGEPEPRGEEDYQYPFEDTIAGETGINLDQSDPLAEADFHMAYGLYDQAAEIIKKAVEREPDRYDLRRKLIDICFVWGNAEEFLAQAKAIHGMKASDEADDWAKIAIMGRQICPGEALFAGEGEAPVDVDFGGDLREPGTTGERAREWLDFDVGESDEPLSALGDTREQPAPRTDLDRPIDQTGELDLEELGIDLDLGETGEHALQDLADRAPEYLDETGEFREGTADLPDLSDLPEPTDEEEATDGGTMMMDPSQMRRASEAQTQRGEGWEQVEDEPTVAGVGGYEDEEPADSTQVRKFEAPDDEPTVTGEGGFEDAEEEEASSTQIKKFTYTEEGPTAEVGGFEDESDADLDLDQLTQALKADLEDSPPSDDEELTQMAPGFESPPQEDFEDADTREQAPSEMSEVGTKLDLARAYVDMGDPDGARSILEEVLEEGDPAQQEEARQLLDSLA